MDTVEATVKVERVAVKNPEEKQVIIGQGNFSIFTCDDLFKTLLTAVPGIKCAVAMNEAVPRLTRVTGNEESLKELASENCLRIAASHSFFIAMDNAFPINVLNALKSHPAVATIFVASANPLDVIVAETELGRAVIGVVDGTSANRIETESEKKERRALCEQLGYALDEHSHSETSLAGSGAENVRLNESRQRTFFRFSFLRFTITT